MNGIRTALAGTTIVALSALSACSGGGGAGSPLPSGGGNAPQSTRTQTEDAINTANAVGTPVSDVANDNETMSALDTGDGTCANGSEFFSPDKHGDANSTELLTFYDDACTQIARDAVRVYVSTGANSETVTRTVSLYALNSSAPEAVKNETVAFSNATFGQFGLPVLSAGFQRVHTGSLSIGGTTTFDADGELIVAPSSLAQRRFAAKLRASMQRATPRSARRSDGKV